MEDCDKCIQNHKVQYQKVESAHTPDLVDIECDCVI